MGMVELIFRKILVWKLKRDPTFKKAADKADIAMDNLQKSIHDAEVNGMVIPDELNKYAGMRTEKELKQSK